MATIPPWVDHAACTGRGELFFGSETETDQARETREAQAKAICSGCRVRSECLVFALERRPKHGIWGGANRNDLENRRRRDRRALRLAAAARAVGEAEGLVAGAAQGLIDGWVAGLEESA